MEGVCFYLRHIAMNLYALAHNIQDSQKGDEVEDDIKNLYEMSFKNAEGIKKLQETEKAREDLFFKRNKRIYGDHS